MIAQKNEETG